MEKNRKIPCRLSNTARKFGINLVPNGCETATLGYKRFFASPPCMHGVPALSHSFRVDPIEVVYQRRKDNQAAVEGRRHEGSALGVLGHQTRRGQDRRIRRRYHQQHRPNAVDVPVLDSRQQIV